MKASWGKQVVNLKYEAVLDVELEFYNATLEIEDAMFKVDEAVLEVRIC